MNSPRGIEELNPGLQDPEVQVWFYNFFFYPRSCENEWQLSLFDGRVQNVLYFLPLLHAHDISHMFSGLR